MESITSHIGVVVVAGGSGSRMGGNLPKQFMLLAGPPIQARTLNNIAEAQPGDILYRMGHVGIYIGGARYIHAPHRGEVVMIASGISSFTCALSYR